MFVPRSVRASHRQPEIRVSPTLLPSETERDHHPSQPQLDPSAEAPLIERCDQKPPQSSENQRLTSPPCPSKEEDLIKERREQQREAEEGEPLCVICSRYGEYICNETDEDVCSLQCKDIALKRSSSRERSIDNLVSSICPTSSSYSASSIRAAPAIHPVKIVSFEDECVYVNDKGHNTFPDWESLHPLTNIQAERLRQEIGVNTKGESVPPPILEFIDCKFPQRLQSNLEIAGFSLPTPVQMQVIPLALKGRDILVRAETGSGKTGSFLLPIIAKCYLIRSRFVIKREKPLAIVMTPTRELCSQVEEQAKVFGKGLPLKTALIVGGDALPQQVYRLKQGVELIIGTPGRLVDLLTKHPIDLSDVCVLVLDEVDCMLEKGFRDEVMLVVRALSRPQVMLFSATIPPSIEKLATSLLKRAVQVFVGGNNTDPHHDNSIVVSHAVKQTVIWVESNKKKTKLFDILKSGAHYRPPLVVFVSSRVGAELLAEAICQVTGLKAEALHGEKEMSERRRVLGSFLMDELPIVVATGVLGRGLDLVKVKQVVVFDMPNSVEEYVHQIGRASRLGMPGSAIVFINNENKGIFKSFVSLLQSSGVFVPKELANSPYLHSSYAVAYHHKRQKRK